ncbi:DNA-3-methyladenine glycosylase I [Oceanotoga sp. DSM 15011]|jgi:DNA-3-methyladenine glycosylase I|uniref:DNA-3-methyladenine glycosylase I n=1 Tax=Oceanotoga sp. DSM 15011 TaxID=2984951 RepID=UPI0021F4B654|nr:DNA-3-methyladenine glycosylase I [Oceanotoga sp. DSM 15011]UYO99497.1 DNA-3-methyladenine glycosylase I [Oceanotoga sp. DSM 15011]
MNRCDWVTNDEIYIKYHDEEWGIPVHDDRKLFEMLILEGAQAGLSWITVLKKRENYRKAFDNFDYNKIANYDDKKIDELLKNSGIIRNKRKINSAINNSKIFIKIINEFDSFDKYLWSFVNFKPIKNNFNTIEDVPSKTELSDKISKDLKKRGMSFVGSTIIYSYLQAVGVVDDHIKSCFKNKRS